MKTLRKISPVAGVALLFSLLTTGIVFTNTASAGQYGYGPNSNYSYGNYSYDKRGYQRAPYPRPTQAYPYRPQASVYSSSRYPQQYRQQPAATANAAATAMDDTATTVSIAGMQFQPAVVRIKAGEDVTWASQAAMPHTVVSTDGKGIASETMRSGSSYSHTFKEPGTYQYHCSIHPSMTGTVIVE